VITNDHRLVMITRDDHRYQHTVIMSRAVNCLKALKNQHRSWGILHTSKISQHNRHIHGYLL